MGTSDHELSIDEADRLLDGHVPAGRDDLAAWASDLTSLSAAYTRDVDPVDVRRWAAQAAAYARLAPTDNGDLAATPASNANRPAQQAAGLPKRRIPVLDSIAAFLATTLGKTVAAGALVAATTTGGLAATGNLPGQADPATPATVEDDSPDPGTLQVGGQDSVDDEGDDADEVDAVDDSTDDACATDPGQAVVAADVAGASVDDDADEADDDSADESDDECDDEVEAVDDDTEADDESSDDATDEADDESSDDESDDQSADDAEDSASVDASDTSADDSGSSDHADSSDDADSPDGDSAPAAAPQG